MKSFTDWYKDASGGHEPPYEIFPCEWFVERGLPMIVECTCCGATMALPTAYIDENDYIFAQCARESRTMPNWGNFSFELPKSVRFWAEF